MKIRKLIAASDIKSSEDVVNDCSISAQEDFDGALDCIQNAINLLAHVLQCDKSNAVAKESIANLAVVLLDLKSSQSAPVVEESPVEEIETAEEGV